MEQGETIRERLPAALASLPNTGAFCAFAEEALSLEALPIDGLGAVAMPLEPPTMERLVRAADRPDPRRPASLAPERVHLEDPGWARLLRKITRVASNRLGADAKVEARLRGVSIQQTGQPGFELPLGPSEPGRFGSLVVALPSVHTGGELTVAHAGRIERVDLNGRAPDVVRWVAFYSEATQRAEPLTMGSRFLLLFSLVAVEGPTPTIPDDSAHVDDLVAMISDWERDRRELPRVVLPLCMPYGQFDLTFARLQGPDRVAHSALGRAATRTGCVLYLGQLVVVEQGTWRARGPDRRAGPIRTRVDWRCELVGLRRADDAPPLPRLLFSPDDELAPPEELDADEADEEKSSNGGSDQGQFTRTWRRAVFALWPLSREDEVFIDSGVEAAQAVLAAMLADPRRQPRAQELAASMVDVWPRGTGSAKVTSWLDPMLDLIRRADRSINLRFLRDVVPDQLLHDRHVPALLAALAELEDADLSDVLVAMARRARGPRAVSALAAALEACRGKRPPELLGPAADELVARAVAIGGEDRPRWEETLSWTEVVGLVRILVAAGRGDRGGQLAGWMLANPRQWPMESLSRHLMSPSADDPALVPLVRPLRLNLRRELSSSMGDRPEPPRDQSRSVARLNCGCSICSGLRAFLAHPSQRDWLYSGTTTELAHLTNAARNAGSDVEFTQIMDRGRRGYRVTKTEESYRRALSEWRTRNEVLRSLGDDPTLSEPEPR